MDNDKSLFGIKKISNIKKDKVESFAPSVNEDGAIEVSVHEDSGFFGYSGNQLNNIDFIGIVKNETELIKKYRRLSLHHEVDNAIDDIINEAIVQMNDEQEVVSINLDDTELSKNIKNKIDEEFKEVLKLLNFNKKAYEIFKSWYVDGRIVYHKIIDESNPKRGIKSLRQIDPLYIQKIKEIIKKGHKNDKRIAIHKDGDEYYIYNEGGMSGSVSKTGIKIDLSAVSYIHSGLREPDTGFIISYLHKAIKPHNQLRMIEDSSVIYRVSRAPERRVFNVDVGGMQPTRAAQYLQDVMNRNKNRLIFDSSSGELQSDRKHMTITEDFYFPKGPDGRGTEVTQLPGGQNLGEIEDILYFQKMFYKSLNIPTSRIDPEADGMAISRTTEISRDELKFIKFIRRLQIRFSQLFSDILKTQLILKGIITESDWDEIEDEISYVFAEDSFFAEAKELENLRERLAVVGEMEDHVGKYFSRDYIRKIILKQDDETIEQIKKQNEEDEDLKSDNNDDEF